MAVSKQQVIVEFDADTGKAEKSVQGLEKSMEGVANAATEAADATAEIGDSAEKSGGGLKKMGKLGGAGFKVIGGAIAATGIGLLVQIVAMLIEKFMENKKVADALAVASAGLGAVFNTIIDLAMKVGEFIQEAFENPQQAITDLKDLIVENITNRINGILNLLPRLGEAIAQAFKGNFSEAGKIATDAVAQAALGVENFTDKVSAAAEAVGEYVKETAAAVSAAAGLEKRLQALANAERDLSVETARQTATIEELKRKRDDERLSIEERIKFAQEAAAIDQRIADENVRIQEEKARLLRQEIELQGETEERLQELADAEIAAADARAASAAVQTEQMTSIYGLNQEALDIEAEVAALRREFLAENLEGIEAERQAIEDQLTDRVAAIERLKITEEEKTALILEATASRDQQLEDLEAAHQAELADIAQKADDEEAARQKTLDDAAQAQRDKELADAEALAKAKLDVTKSSLDALLALNEAFAGDSEEEQKKAFERSKKIQSAQALISTYESAVQAFKSLAGIPVVGPALGAAAAAAAVAAGIANVKKIQSQTFGGGGSEPEVPSTEGVTAAAAAGGGGATAPQLDLSFLGEGAGQAAPVQAYVLAENVSNAQQANQKIQDQATL